MKLVLGNLLLVTHGTILPMISGTGMGVQSIRKINFKKGVWSWKIHVTMSTRLSKLFSHVQKQKEILHK